MLFFPLLNLVVIFFIVLKENNWLQLQTKLEMLLQVQNYCWSIQNVKLLFFLLLFFDIYSYICI